MFPVICAETATLAETLACYQRRATISTAAALQTVPGLQANALRVELFAHLAVAKCQGRKVPTNEEVEKWLNEDLGQGQIVLAEDPAEDVFITNIRTPDGNRRIFEGLWESNDYYLQVAIDTLTTSQGAPAECRALLAPALALLRLSDALADRLNVSRWYFEPSSPARRLEIDRSLQLQERIDAVTFTDAELARLGVERALIDPFVLRPSQRQQLLTETVGDSSLERRPLIQTHKAIILSLPSAVSPAIRWFLLTKLRRMGYLSEFQRACAEKAGSRA